VDQQILTKENFALQNFLLEQRKEKIFFNSNKV